MTTNKEEGKERGDFCEKHQMFKKNCKEWQAKGMLDDCSPQREEGETDHFGQMDKMVGEQKGWDWEKEFDEMFVDKIKDINGGLAYEELKHGEHTDIQELRDFITFAIREEREKIREKVGSLEVMGIGGNFGKGYEGGFRKAQKYVIDLLKE